MISISEENKTLRKMEIGPLKPNHTKLVKAFVENLESSEVYQLSKASPLISDYISLRSNEIRHFRDLLSMLETMMQRDNTCKLLKLMVDVGVEPETIECTGLYKREDFISGRGRKKRTSSSVKSASEKKRLPKAPKIHLGEPEKLRRAKVVKWTPEQDRALVELVEMFDGSWIKIAAHLNKRFKTNFSSGKCSQRFCRVLSPNRKTGIFSLEESLTVISEAGKNKSVRISWKAIADLISERNKANSKDGEPYRRTDTQCRDFYRRISETERVPWTAAADRELVAAVEENKKSGSSEWERVVQKLKSAGVTKTADQCYRRFAELSLLT